MQGQSPLHVRPGKPEDQNGQQGHPPVTPQPVQSQQRRAYQRDRRGERPEQRRPESARRNLLAGDGQQQPGQGKEGKLKGKRTAHGTNKGFGKGRAGPSAIPSLCSSHEFCAGGIGPALRAQLRGYPFRFAFTFRFL